MQSIIKKEGFKYLVVGVLSVLTDFLTYTLFLFVIDHSPAKALSYIMGMCTAFFLNRYWTFQSKNKVHSDGVKFIILYTTTLLVNVCINTTILTVLPGFIILAFIVATGTSIVLNYLGQKFFVFSTK
jgi:putative flippase GtrA